MSHRDETEMFASACYQSNYSRITGKHEPPWALLSGRYCWDFAKQTVRPAQDQLCQVGTVTVPLDQVEILCGDDPQTSRLSGEINGRPAFGNIRRLVRRIEKPARTRALSQIQRAFRQPGVTVLSGAHPPLSPGENFTEPGLMRVWLSLMSVEILMTVRVNSVRLAHPSRATHTQQSR